MPIVKRIVPFYNKRKTKAKLTEVANSKKQIMKAILSWDSVFIKAFKTAIEPIP